MLLGITIREKLFIGGDLREYVRANRNGLDSLHGEFGFR